MVRFTYALVFFAFIQAVLLAGVDRVYFMDANNSASPDIGTVYRIYPDGSGLELLSETPIPGYCRGLAFDSVNNRVVFTRYWDTAIWQCTLNPVVCGPIAQPGGRPEGIVIDHANGKLYWVETDFNAIVQSGLYGENPTQLISFLNSPTGGIALDPPRGKIYWTEQGGILRANMNGTGIELVVPNTQPLIFHPYLVAVDSVNQRVYWWDNSLKLIASARLDGSDITLLGDNLDKVGDIELDVTAGKLYYSRTDFDRLYSRDLTGGGGFVIIEIGFHGGPSAIALDLSGLDCNTNGIPDQIDTASGMSSDCNGNATPDSCELSGNDCNATGIPDECELSANDCNNSAVPDECELSNNDCNGNDVPDDCDIASATSTDCTVNAIPDECENAPDCDGNGIADYNDLCAGTSSDCTGNGVLDNCETVPDCNGNALADHNELCNGTVYDCNLNSVPDDCELGIGDCNGNSIPDVCDLGRGTSVDCDVDGIPDECDSVVYCPATRLVTDVNSGGGFSKSFNNKYALVAAVSPTATGISASVPGPIPPGSHSGGVIYSLAMGVWESEAYACTDSFVHGDIAPPGGNGVVSLDDILMAIMAFANQALFPAADIDPCGPGNGTVNLDDILAVLQAFSGNPRCADPCQ